MRHLKLVCTLVALTALSTVVVSQTTSGHALFEQALAKERVEGNLREAIRLYERVVAEFASDRALAARALVQMGLSYEKLGRDEAVRVYERLVRDFADQQDAVVQARARLAALVRAPAAAPAAMTLRPLPDVSQDGELVAVSPDGTKAIVMDYSSGQNLALYEFGSNPKRLLTTVDWSTGWIYFGVWSPDSRRVAYQQNSQGDNPSSELRVTTLDGQSRVVYRTEGTFAVQPVGWTPDGATLVAVVRRPDGTWTLGTLPAGGGAFTPLRSFGWSYNWFTASPRLSPDGRFIALLEGEAGLRDVHVIGLDGREAHRITDDPADDFLPLWSSDGRHLAFISNRVGTVSLWAVEVEDGRPAGPAVKLKDGMVQGRLIDWTPRGIFYDQQTSTWDLYTAPMDPVDGRPTAAPRLLPYARTGRNVSPAWSPDGKRLAFVSSTAADPNRRYVVVTAADGSDSREFLVPTSQWQYTNTPYDLRWFGNGRGLGFSGLDTQGVPAIFRLLLETGEWDTIRLPADVGSTAQVEWNGDGSAVYFRRQWANAGIFERLVRSDAERLVYGSSVPLANIQRLQFSPDRTWLAFQDWPADPAANTMIKRIRILDVDTGEARTVLEAPARVNPTDPRPPNLMGWSPAGELIVERYGTGNEPSEVLIVPVNGGAPRSLALPAVGPTAPGETPPDRIAKWSPDGRTLAISRVNRAWETFVIEHPLALTAGADSRQ